MIHAGTPGGVSIINGSTNAVTTVINPSAHNPEGLAVNTMNNKIYVANTGSSNVTVIDGGATPTSHVLWALMRWLRNVNHKQPVVTKDGLDRLRILPKSPLVEAVRFESQGRAES